MSIAYCRRHHPHPRRDSIRRNSRNFTSINNLGGYPNPKEQDRERIKKTRNPKWNAVAAPFVAMAKI